MFLVCLRFPRVLLGNDHIWKAFVDSVWGAGVLGSFEGGAAFLGGRNPSGRGAEAQLQRGAKPATRREPPDPGGNHPLPSKVRILVVL